MIERETYHALRSTFQTLTIGPPHRWGEGKTHIAQQPWPGREFVAHYWSRAQPWRSLSLRQRRGIQCYAASSGHAASLEVALAYAGCTPMSEALDAAAAAGSVPACLPRARRELRYGGIGGLSAGGAAAAPQRAVRRPQVRGERMSGRARWARAFQLRHRHGCATSGLHIKHTHIAVSTGSSGHERRLPFRFRPFGSLMPHECRH